MEAVMDTRIEQLLLHTLRSSGEGLDAFCDHLIAAADAFERGDDAAGLRQLETVFPPMQDFATFCGSLMSVTAGRAPEYAPRLERVANRLEDSFGTMCSGLTNQDYAGVADVARYDLVEVLDEFGIVFGELLPVLETRLQMPEDVHVN